MVTAPALVWQNERALAAPKDPLNPRHSSPQGRSFTDVSPRRGELGPPYITGDKPAVAVKIKLKRLGKTHAPQYRIVVADSRTARNGRAIEEIGIYQPLQDPSIISVKSDRVLYWLGVGALPTPAVEAILKITGDWQKFKGLPGTEGTLRVAPPKVNKIAVFEAAVAEAANEPKIVKKPKLETPVEVVAEVAAAEVVAEVAAAEVIAEEIAEEVATESAVTEVVSEDAPADVTPA